MRILFLAANREHLPDPVVPLGLLSVAASCPPGHERHVVDLCFEADPMEAARRAVADARPELVAVSLRNVHRNDYGSTAHNVRYYRALVAALREATRAPIVLGGGGYTVMPVALLDALGADFGVAGEGEEVFAALVRALDEGGRRLERIGGLYRRIDGRVIAPAAATTLVDLTSLPIADRRLVDRRHYERCGTDSVQTKRGCPLTCSYCTYPLIEGRASRLRPPARVADELEHVRAVAPEVDHVFVVDAVFNLPRSHAEAVCDALIARDLGLPWTCYVNPIELSPRLAAKMAAAGCAGMEVGADSGSEAVLRRLRKGFDTAAIRRLREVARGAGLKDCHTFLLGTPGETLDEVKRTLDFVVDLDPFAAILMVWNDERESLDPRLAAERAELRSEVLAMLDAERHRHPRWVIPPLGHRFSERTFALLRRRGLSGPLWQHLDRVAA